MGRWFRHFTTTRFALTRCFPEPVLTAIERAVTESERLHRAELRFAIETALPAGYLYRGVTPRERAAEVFAELGMWDTAENNGVLVYVLLADQDIEIVADRGLRGAVTDAQWESVCTGLEADFRAGRYGEGVVAAIRHITGLLAPVFPPQPDRPDRPDELPDRPVLL